MRDRVRPSVHITKTSALLYGMYFFLHLGQSRRGLEIILFIKILYILFSN